VVGRIGNWELRVASVLVAGIDIFEAVKTVERRFGEEDPEDAPREEGGDKTDRDDEGDPAADCHGRGGRVFSGRGLT
jgi:hypothetical protein